MRLLMLPRYSALGASSRLRSLQYLPVLQEAGIDVDVVPLLDDDYVRNLYTGNVSISRVARAYWQRLRHTRELLNYDAVWLEKEAWPWLPGRLELALVNSRARLVVDYDDAVFHRYDAHRSRLVRSVLGGKIDAVMHRADLVIAGNNYLAGRARDAGCRRVEWLPTVVDLQRYPPPGATCRNPDDAVVVGWIGSPSTAGYLRHVSTVLAPLQASGRIRCIAVGARPDQLVGTPFQAQPWREETEVEQLYGFDIGIMPLPDAPWERGKCGYKLVQYMACGLPVVASPVGVSADMVVHGENGFLASRPEDWIEAVEQLAQNVGLRRRMGLAGRRRVEDVYCLQIQSKRLIGMLRSMATENAR